MTEMNRRMVTVTVLALLLCTSLAIVVEPVDAAEDEVFTIDMRTGQRFVYEPTTNLDSEFRVSGSDGVSWDPETGTVNASFGAIDTSGGLQAVIEAVWTSDVDPDVSMSAKQIVCFRVYGHVTIDGQFDSSVSRGLIGGQTAGAVVYSPTIPQATPGTETTVSCAMPENDWIAWDAESMRVVTVRDIPEDVEDVSVSFDVTATNRAVSEESTLKEETATVHVTVSIGQDIRITSPDVIETYVGNRGDGNIYTVTTNFDGKTGVTITGIQIGQVVPSVAGLVASKGDGTVTFDPDAVDFGDRPTRPYYKEYTFGVTVDGIAADGNEVQDSRIVTLRVWAGLDFITIPSMEDVTLVADAENTLSVRVDAVVGDADGIRFSWGDGSGVQDVDAEGISGPVGADHVFPDAGSYVITVSAYNQSGENVTYILYDATTGTWDSTDVPPGSDDQSEDGRTMVWLAIVLAIVSVASALTYVFGPRNIVFVVCSAISGILAVVLYVV